RADEFARSFGLAAEHADAGQRCIRLGVVGFDLDPTRGRVEGGVMFALEQKNHRQRLVDERRGWIELPRTLRRGEGFVQPFRRTVQPCMHQGFGQTGMRGGVVRIERDRAFVKLPCRVVALGRIEAVLLAAAQDTIVGFGIFGLDARPRTFGADEPDFERGHDLRRDVVLHRENIHQLAVVAFGPEMRAAPGVDELARYAHAIARFAHAAFEHVANTELRADPFHVDRLAFVGEARIARDDVQFGQFRQAGDDVVGDAVGKIFLLRVAAHIAEGEHGDGGFVGNGRRCAGGVAVLDPDAEDLDGIGDVFGPPRAARLDADRDLAANLIGDRARDVDRTGLGQSLDPRRDIDAVAVNVVALDDDVADIDADAERDAVALGDVRVALGDALLHFDRACDRVHRAGEFDQCAVADELDGAAGVGGNGRIDDLAPQGFE